MVVDPAAAESYKAFRICESAKKAILDCKIVNSGDHGHPSGDWASFTECAHVKFGDGKQNKIEFAVSDLR